MSTATRDWADWSHEPWNGRVPEQVVPAVVWGERAHVLDETCWCEPGIVLPVGQGEVAKLIHRVVDTGHPQYKSDHR